MNRCNSLLLTALAALASVAANGATPLIGPNQIISSPGSYVLTSNILVSGSANGILIEAANVTLDLGGYAISCTNCGTGSGVIVYSTGTHIMNGTITGFSGSSADATGAGINLAAGADVRVDHIMLEKNYYGLSGAANARVDIADSVVHANVGDGVSCSQCYVNVRDSRISSNAGAGLVMGPGMVTGASIMDNGRHGIVEYPGPGLDDIIHVTNSIIIAARGQNAIFQANSGGTSPFVSVGFSTLEGSGPIGGSANYAFYVGMNTAGSCFNSANGDVGNCDTGSQTLNGTNHQ